MNRDECNIGFKGVNIWFVYLFAYLPLCLLPAIKYSVPYVIAGLFTMFPLFWVSLNNTRYRTILFFLVILGFIQGSIVALLGNAPATEVFNEPIRSVRYFVPCVLLDKVFDFSKRNQKIIWFFTTALIAYVIFQTLNAVETNPMIARLLAQGSVDDAELMSYRFQNIGGFGNCYSVCLTFAMWVYFMFHSSKVMKVISTAVAILVFYFTIQVQYMTMLLLCIVAALCVILFCTKNQFAKVFSLVFVVIAFFSLSSILRWIASMGVESQIYTKLINVANVLDGASSLGDTTSRADLYKTSFSAFLSSPIWGATGDLNSHSTILAFAANSGIIGLFAYFYGIKQMYSTTKIRLKERNTDGRVFDIVFVLFIVLSVVNPVHYVYEISVVLLFYIPLTLALFGDKPIIDK